MKTRNYIIKTLSTFFYVGYLPFIPGTFASIVGLYLFYLMKGDVFKNLFFLSLFTLLGFIVSGKAEKIFNKKDAKCIVIDEVSGMLLAFVFLPYNAKVIIIAFILFRILDALKPYPADRLQDLRGSRGVMGDDLVAGLYANIILQVVLRLASFRPS